MIGVILAGGSGHRLWPRSRRQTPKQFQDLLGQGESLLQATFRRVAPVLADAWVVTNAATAHLAKDQLPAVPAHQILSEPSSRNTAPAIAWFLAHAERVAADDVVAILPSDHWVRDGAALRQALREAARLAQADRLVLLGARPDHPHCGYGYIEIGDALAAASALRAYAIRRFQEKPSLAAAQAMVATGGFLWNCGIFVSRLGHLREMFRTGAADMLAAAHAPGPEHAAWARLPAISFDYALAEKARAAAVVQLETGWTDLGSWDALDRIATKNAEANAIIGGNVVAVDSDHNIVCANGRLIAMVGVKDLVVVDTPDALLVGHKAHMQAVKDVISELKSTGRNGVT